MLFIELLQPRSFDIMHLKVVTVMKVIWTLTLCSGLFLALLPGLQPVSPVRTGRRPVTKFTFIATTSSWMCSPEPFILFYFVRNTNRWGTGDWTGATHHAGPQTRKGEFLVCFLVNNGASSALFCLNQVFSYTLQDPYSILKPKQYTGTKADPHIVPSIGNKRLVGCLCKPVPVWRWFRNLAELTPARFRLILYFFSGCRRGRQHRHCVVLAPRGRPPAVSLLWVSLQAGPPRTAPLRRPNAPRRRDIDMAWRRRSPSVERALTFNLYSLALKCVTKTTQFLPVSVCVCLQNLKCPKSEASSQALKHGPLQEILSAQTHPSASTNVVGEKKKKKSLISFFLHQSKPGLLMDGSQKFLHLFF